MGNIKRFLYGVTSNYLYIVVSSLIALWLTPYTLHFVSKSHYGYYILLADILTWVGLLQFGVSGVFNSKAAMCIGEKDYESLQRYTSTANLMQVVSASLVLIVGVVLSLNADKILDTTAISRSEVLITFIIVAITSSITIIRHTFSAILIANKQIHIDNILNLLSYLVLVGFTVLFLNCGYSIISLAMSHLIATILMTLVAYYRIKHLSFQLNFSFRGFDKTIFWEFLSIGIWFTIGHIGQIFIYKVDRFLIGSYISLEMVTYYYITSRLYDFTNIFFSNFVNIARPYFSQLYAQNNIKRLRHIYDLFVNGTVLLLVFLCSIIYLLNQWFIGWWIKDYNSAYLGDELSLLLAISFILQAAVLPNRSLLESTLYKVKYQGITRITEGGVKFILSLFLIEYWGIKGLVIASIVSCIMCSTIFTNYLSNKVLQSSISHQLKNYIPYTSILFLILLYYIPNKIVGFSLIVLLYMTCAVVYWLVGFDETTKAELKLMFKKKL